MFVARVIAKLEPGGAQLSTLRVMRELGGHGIASVLYCGWATPAGIELARRYGLEPEVWGEGGNLQWVPEPRFAAWLDPRLAAVDLVHAVSIFRADAVGLDQHRAAIHRAPMQHAQQPE